MAVLVKNLSHCQVHFLPSKLLQILRVTGHHPPSGFLRDKSIVWDSHQASLSSADKRKASCKTDLVDHFNYTAECTPLLNKSGLDPWFCFFIFLILKNIFY